MSVEERSKLISGISARNVTARYGDTLVFDGFSLDIRPGLVTALVGPNGSGKSTLLRAISGMLHPDGGAIIFDGSELGELVTRVRMQKIAYLPQHPIMSQELTVERLVSKGRDSRVSRSEPWSEHDAEVIDRVLHRSGLHTLRDELVGDLSAAERQRVWVAMVLAQDGNLLLLDEPTSHLDPYQQLELWNVVTQVSAEYGVTVVVATHDLTGAARFAHDMVLLRDGQLVAAGTVSSVATTPNFRRTLGVECVIDVDDSGRLIVVPVGVVHAARENPAEQTTNS